MKRAISVCTLACAAASVQADLRVIPRTDIDAGVNRWINVTEGRVYTTQPVAGQWHLRVRGDTTNGIPAFFLRIPGGRRPAQSGSVRRK